MSLEGSSLNIIRFTLKCFVLYYLFSISSWNSKIKNPAPGEPNPASFEGTRNNAKLFNFRNCIVTSHLTFDLKSGSRLVVNMAGSDGMFGPGYVARMVKNGKTHTYGEGTAIKQSHGVMGYFLQDFANEALLGYADGKHD